MDPNDDRVEERLRRYRPIGPPVSLRARSLTPPRDAAVWPWAVAAAALVAIALGMQSARAGALARAGVMLPPDASAPVVAELAGAFGGDPGARRMAEWIVGHEAWLAAEAEPAAVEDRR